MRWCCTVWMALGMLACCGVVRADLIGGDCQNDGDGKIDCTALLDLIEADGEYGMYISGKQFSDPGHMLGNFYTNSALDPTIRIINSLENDTAFAWTDYHVKVSMNNPFTLSANTVYTPSNWTSSATQPTQDGTTYTAYVDYYAGTPIEIGQTLEFGYKISFSGATSYSYTQEMTPTPEPGSVALVVTGALAGLFVLVRRQRSFQH